MDRNRLTLKALAKEDDDGQVRLNAELSAPCRSDEFVEQLVTRLSLESAVTSVNWSSSALRPPLKAGKQSG